MNSNGHLLVDSKLIEDYQLSSPVELGRAVCATQWDGKPATCSIGNDSHIHFTYRDSGAQSGWRQESIPYDADQMDASWSPEFGTLIFIVSREKESFEGFQEQMYADRILWRKPGEQNWQVVRSFSPQKPDRIRIAYLGGKVLVMKTFEDYRFPQQGVFNTYTDVFTGKPCTFGDKGIVSDSKLVEFGIGPQGEIGVYVMLTPHLVLQSSNFQWVLNDKGNKGAEHHNLNVWSPVVQQDQFVLGHFAQSGGYDESQFHLSSGPEPRLVGIAVEDPTGTLPPIFARISKWKQVYTDKGTGGSHDFQLLQPDLSAPGMQDYRPVGAFGCLGHGLGNADRIAGYAVHQDHVLPASYFAHAGTLSAPEEDGNVQNIWYTDNCGKKGSCASVSEIKAVDDGESIRAFWAKSGVDRPDANSGLAYVPVLEGKRSVILFAELYDASGTARSWTTKVKWHLIHNLGYKRGRSLSVSQGGRGQTVLAYTLEDGSVQVLEVGKKAYSAAAIPALEGIHFRQVFAIGNAQNRTEIFAISRSGNLFHSQYNPTASSQAALLPVFPAPETTASVALTQDSVQNVAAFLVNSGDAGPQRKVLLVDPQTSNLTVQPLHTDGGAAELLEIRAFNLQITATDAFEAPYSGTISIWTEGPTLLKVNGKSQYLDPYTRKVIQLPPSGQVRISIPTNTLFAPVLHVSAGFMEAGEFVTLSPNAEIQYKLRQLEADGLEKAVRNPLSSKPQPLLPDASKTDMQAYSEFLKEAMALVPEHDYEAERKYLRLNRDLAPMREKQAKARPIAQRPLQYTGLAMLPGKRFGLQLRDGKASFLSGELAMRLAPMEKSVGQWFEGTWGDVWQFVKSSGKALANGFEILIATIGHGIQATIEFVVNGVKYVYQGVAKLVQEVFSMVEGVFSTIGLAFHDLVEWLGYLFDWNDILRTQRALQHVTNGMLDHTMGMLTTFKEQVSSFIDQGAQRFDAYMDLFALQLTENQSLASAISNNSSNNNADSTNSHNIVMNGMLDNADAAGDIPLQADNGAMGSLIDKFAHRLGGFVQDAALNDIKEQLANLPQTAEAFMTTGLANIVRLLRKVGDLAFGIAQDLVEAIIDLVISQVQQIKDALNAAWEIPWVTALYKKVTHLDTMSISGILHLIVAVPTTPLLKIGLGHAPFGTDQELDEFCADFDGMMAQMRPKSQKTLVAAKVQPYTGSRFFDLFNCICVSAKATCNLISIVPDSLLALAPPPLPAGEMARLLANPRLEKYFQWFNVPTWMKPLAYISTLSDLLYQLFDFPVRALQKAIKADWQDPAGAIFMWSTMAWIFKFVPPVSDLISLKQKGLQLQNQKEVMIAINMVLGMVSIVADVVEIAMSDLRNSDILSFVGNVISKVPRVASALRFDPWVISSGGLTLVGYSVVNLSCKSAAFALNTAAVVEAVKAYKAEGG